MEVNDTALKVDADAKENHAATRDGHAALKVPDAAAARNNFAASKDNSVANSTNGDTTDQGLQILNEDQNAHLFRPEASGSFILDLTTTCH